MQAIALIRDASQYDDVALAVSWSGDVREANMVERVIYGIIDFFDAGAPERRRNQAREAVKAKLCNEYIVLAGSASAGKPFVLTKEIKNAISTVASKLIDQGTIPRNNIPANLSDALKNISEISQESDASRRLIWQAIADQRKEHKEVRIDAAKNIATNTRLWGKSLHISSRDAFRLATNAWRLYEKAQILPEDGKDVLLCAGRLSSRHSFSHKDALSYAIDLHIPLKKLGVGMDSIERVMKSLDYAIPELRTQSDRVRLSAAIRYLQLQDAKHKDLNAIDEIRRSLFDLPLLQKALPKGCVIDQIHQGFHIRSQSMHRFPAQSPLISDDNVLTAAEQTLVERANKLISGQPLGSTGKPVHEVSLPEIFANFFKHHVEDLVRSNQYELLTEKDMDTEFGQIENERRKNPKQLSPNGYQQWADKRIAWAGSMRVAEMISCLESQALFADIATFFSKQFLNQAGYSVTAAGENNLAQTSFQASRPRVTNAPDTTFSLHQTHYINATRLLAEPDDVDQLNEGKLFKRPQIEIPLIPNPGPDKKASATGFSVKRSVRLSLVVPRFAEIPATCRITEVSEEWDLMVDWDAWMTMRPEVGTL